MKNYGLDPMGRLVSNVFLVRNATVMLARGTNEFSRCVFRAHLGVASLEFLFERSGHGVEVYLFRGRSELKTSKFCSCWARFQSFTVPQERFCWRGCVSVWRKILCRAFSSLK